MQSVAPTSVYKTGFFEGVRKFFKFQPPKPKPQVIVMFCKQLSSFVRVGIPVTSAIQAFAEQAPKKSLRKIYLLDTTIPHQVLGRFGSGMVLLKPAPEGTGVIAGGPVRAVVQAAGIPNVLTKSIGSHNPHNVVKATINALEQLRDKHVVAEMRGVAVEKM